MLKSFWSQLLQNMHGICDKDIYRRREKSNPMSQNGFVVIHTWKIINDMHEMKFKVQSLAKNWLSFQDKTPEYGCGLLLSSLAYS